MYVYKYMEANSMRTFFFCFILPYCLTLSVGILLFAEQLVKFTLNLLILSIQKGKTGHLGNFEVLLEGFILRERETHKCF